MKRIDDLYFQVQILDHDLYSKQADSNRIRATSIPSPRGLILDRNGEIIVDNYPTYILYGIDAEILDKNKNYEIINKIKINYWYIHKTIGIWYGSY